MPFIENQFSSLIDVVVTDAWITAPTGEHVLKVKAIWDTGSTHTLITDRVVNFLRLKPTGKSEVVSLGGVSLESTYVVNLNLAENLHIDLLRTIGCKALGRDLDVLIGMDVIRRGDFILSQSNKATYFCFQLPAKGLPLILQK